MAVKMNLTIITKNHAADREIGFLKKSISKPNGYATTAWELIIKTKMHHASFSPKTSLSKLFPTMPYEG